jgi:hypothetical protein
MGVEIRTGRESLAYGPEILHLRITLGTFSPTISTYFTSAMIKI